MSEFVQKADVKRSVRVITTKIADVATLNSLVQGVIDANSFQCVDHIVTGETHPGTIRSSQSYGVRVVYENPTTLKNMGTATAKASTVAGYAAASPIVSKLVRTAL
jgi:putative NIF3 family GTP cyclohydrolase 1 type 2